MHRIFGVIVSLFLLLLAWPSSYFNILILCAFAPILAIIFEGYKQRGIVLLFTVFYAFFLFGTHYEMFFLDGPQRLTQLLVGLLLVPIFWTIPIFISVFLMRRFHFSLGILIFPFLYTANEMMFMYGEMDYVFSHLCYGAVETKWVASLAALGSPFYVTLFVISINTILAELLRKKYYHEPFKKLLLLGLSVFILGGLLGFKLSNEKVSKRNILVFQPTQDQLKTVQDSLIGQVALLDSFLSKQNVKNIELIICPEAFLNEKKRRPLFINTLDKQPAILYLLELSLRYKAPILSGAILVELYKSDTFPTITSKRQSAGWYFDVYNGSVFITPSGNVEWRSKKRLVPFTEKTPFYSELKSISNKGYLPFQIRSEYATNIDFRPYSYSGLTIAPLICYEFMFHDVVKKSDSPLVDYFVILSNQWTASEKVLKRQSKYAKMIAYSSSKPVFFLGNGTRANFVEN